VWGGDGSDWEVERDGRIGLYLAEERSLADLWRSFTSQPTEESSGRENDEGTRNFLFLRRGAEEVRDGDS